jgi:hypothetical protein
LYGNAKYRPPFPALSPVPAGTGELDCGRLDPGVWGGEAVRGCSVCRQPIGETGPHQVWISLGVGIDVLPLLVNACSPECVAALPAPAPNHVAVPHAGGPGLRQPPRR